MTNISYLITVPTVPGCLVLFDFLQAHHALRHSLQTQVSQSRSKIAVFLLRPSSLVFFSCPTLSLCFFKTIKRKPGYNAMINDWSKILQIKVGRIICFNQMNIFIWVANQLIFAYFISSTLDTIF